MIARHSPLLIGMSPFHRSPPTVYRSLVFLRVSAFNPCFIRVNLWLRNYLSPFTDYFLSAVRSCSQAMSRSVSLVWRGPVTPIGPSVVFSCHL